MTLTLLCKIRVVLQVLCSVLFITSCTQTSSDKAEAKWHLVYKNDKDGKPSFGTIEDLKHAIRNGVPVRVGWSSKSKSDSTKSVEHVVEATFLTIANQKEVFAQIPPFVAQRPDLNSENLTITAMPIHSYWILGTNGYISSVNLLHHTDSIAEYPPRLFGHSLSWFVQQKVENEALKTETSLWDD